MTCISRLFALLLSVVLTWGFFSPVQAQDAPFITVWDTENSGETADDQIKIPGTGTDYQIIWEELGNTENTGSLTATDEVTITFPNPGVYRVKISGNFTRIHFGGIDGGDASKILEVTQWGDIQWSTMKEAFGITGSGNQAYNLEIAAGDTPDLSSVESMAQMFADASSLTASNSNIGQWDVSNVSFMQLMFDGADSFNADIGDWSVSSVTNMEGLFRDAASFNQMIGQWNVSNVTSMFRMFDGASNFNQSISQWNVSNVTNMASMFEDASNFNQDVGSWDISNVENMLDMFKGSALSTGRSYVESFLRGVKARPPLINETARVARVARARGRVGARAHRPGSGHHQASGQDAIAVALSTTNYDRMLMRWAPLRVEEGVLLDADAEYCDSGPFRTHLEEEFNWTIDDGGQQAGCPDDLVAAQARQVDADGTYNFGDVATSMSFFGVLGSGRVTLARYSDQTQYAELITPLNDNVSQYRLVAAGSGISFFDSTQVRHAVSGFGGISQPEAVVVHRTTGIVPVSISWLDTSVNDNGTPSDISDDTLSATTDGSNVSASGFGEFFFSSDVNELPVELASFNGTVTNGGARLTWETASETNNAGFKVQRKEESGWSQMGFVESKADGGSTTEAKSYQYTTEDLSVGTHQFRLKQVDLDGSSQVRGPISVDVQMQEALKLTAPAPNPVSSTATLSFAVKEQAEATVAVYDMLGRKAATLFEGTPTPGESTPLRLDASTLPSGAYLLRLRAAGRTETQRVTVLR